jgi:hypothetical protein
MASMSSLTESNMNAGRRSAVVSEEAVDGAGGERRRRRSEDAITALHYQLAATRWEANLDALVLVDDSGCLVAGVGSWPVCEELAAFAPLLAHPTAIRDAGLGTRLAALSSHVELLRLSLDGVAVLLCGRGGNDKRGASIARAAAGCQRILS